MTYAGPEHLEERVLLSVAPRVSYPVGSDSRSITVGDFDRDGVIDLVVADYSAGTAGVMRGLGDGTFGPGVDYAVGPVPRALAAADLDNDGDADLAAANYLGVGTVSVLLGNGDGTFQARVGYATDLFTHDVAVRDFNNDGRPDLATANAEAPAGTVSVLLGNGDGTFQPRINFAAGAVPYSITTADFNGDGRADVAASNLTTASVSVLLGNGDGTFQAAVALAVGTSPYTVESGDFNGDGHPDLVTSNALSNTVSVLLGNGDGTFQSRVDYATGTGPVSVAVGDLDGDGRADLAVSDYNSGTVGVLVGNGDGTFQARTPYDAGPFPQAVVLGHFEGSGLPDMATVNVPGFVSVLLSRTGLITETTLVVPAGPTSYGQSASITAIVTAGPPGPIPAGSVQFAIDGADFGAPVVLVAGRAILDIATLPAGVRMVSARYVPVPGFIFSATLSPATHQVTPRRLTVTAVPRSRRYGRANPKFAVSYDGFVLGQGPADLRGTLAFDTAAAPSSLAGVYPVTPKGLDSPNYEILYVGVLLSVAPAPVAVTLAVSPAPSPGNRLVALDALVKPADPKATAIPPGGWVIFSLDGRPIGKSRVIGGHARLGADLRRAGVRRLTATFVGDGGFAPGLSAPVERTVKPPVLGPPLTLVRDGVRARPGRLVLTFSTQLDPSRAGDPTNYRIDVAGRDRLFGTKDDLAVAVRSVTYDATARSVTLRPARRLLRRGDYRLTVNGAPTDGLRSLAGVPLDGAGNGRPGTDLTARIDGSRWAEPALSSDR